MTEQADFFVDETGIGVLFAGGLLGFLDKEFFLGGCINDIRVRQAVLIAKHVDFVEKNDRTGNNSELQGQMLGKQFQGIAFFEKTDAVLNGDRRIQFRHRLLWLRPVPKVIETSCGTRFAYLNFCRLGREKRFARSETTGICYDSIIAANVGANDEKKDDKDNENDNEDHFAKPETLFPGGMTPHGKRVSPFLKNVIKPE